MDDSTRVDGKSTLGCGDHGMLNIRRRLKESGRHCFIYIYGCISAAVTCLPPAWLGGGLGRPTARDRVKAQESRHDVNLVSVTLAARRLSRLDSGDSRHGIQSRTTFAPTCPQSCSCYLSSVIKRALLQNSLPSTPRIIEGIRATAGESSTTLWRASNGRLCS